MASSGELMIESEVKVVNKLGLHARACSKVVKAAAGFESDITLTHCNHSVSAKGIMGLMMLAATQGTTLKLEVDGDDEVVAHETIHELFRSGFGEDY